MKHQITLIIILSTFYIGCTNQTPAEKMKVTADTAKRSLEESSNRASEAICGTLTGDNKLECLAKEVKNRAIENKDYIIDKGEELKDKVDD